MLIQLGYKLFSYIVNDFNITTIINSLWFIGIEAAINSLFLTLEVHELRNAEAIVNFYVSPFFTRELTLKIIERKFGVNKIFKSIPPAMTISLL